MKKWYLPVLKEHYADFQGRARRQTYWMYVLCNCVVAIVLGLIGLVIGTKLLSNLYSLAVLVPGLAINARRLHDTGRSGWWQLIALVPVVGFIVLLIFLCQDSKPEANKWGANPKA